MSQRPDLAALVKAIRLRNIDTTDNASPIEDWITEPLNRFSELLAFPGTTFDPEASNWESFVAPLILLQVPNLKYLFVGHKGDHTLFDRFDKPALVRQQALPLHINDFMVGFDREIPGTQSEYPGPLDLSKEGLGGIFPALRHLRHLSIFQPNINTVRDPLQLQHVAKLDCKAFSLRKKQLRTLISAPAALKVFSYTSCYRDEEEFATGQDICELLTPHKDTLWQLWAITYYSGGSFMSMRRLENIRSLIITVEGFWNPIDEPILDEQALVAAFPPSLKDVQLWIDENNWTGIIDAIITYLLSAGKQHTLRLVYINLTSGPWSVVWDETRILRFQESLRAIDQRLEEMSDSITDRPKTGTVKTMVKSQTSIPDGPAFRF
ncbi:hypothetical protein ACHAPA_001627 [Fusarium lateritium]